MRYPFHPNNLERNKNNMFHNIFSLFQPPNPLTEQLNNVNSLKGIPNKSLLQLTSFTSYKQSSKGETNNLYFLHGFCTSSTNIEKCTYEVSIFAIHLFMDNQPSKYLNSYQLIIHHQVKIFTIKDILQHFCW